MTVFEIDEIVFQVGFFFSRSSQFVKEFTLSVEF